MGLQQNGGEATQTPHSCKICQKYFGDDGAVWRHLGKECFITKDSRHVEVWREKEDRWGHEDDAECCGDGTNFARGMSFESVQLFQEAAARKERDDAECCGDGMNFA